MGATWMATQAQNELVEGLTVQGQAWCTAGPLLHGCDCFLVNRDATWYFRLILGTPQNPVCCCTLLDGRLSYKLDVPGILKNDTFESQDIHMIWCFVLLVVLFWCWDCMLDLYICSLLF